VIEVDADKLAVILLAEEGAPKLSFKTSLAADHSGPEFQMLQQQDPNNSAKREGHH